LLRRKTGARSSSPVLNCLSILRCMTYLVLLDPKEIARASSFRAPRVATSRRTLTGQFFRKLFPSLFVFGSVRKTHRRNCPTMLSAFVRNCVSSAARTRNISAAGPCGRPLSQSCFCERFRPPLTVSSGHDPVGSSCGGDTGQPPARQPPAGPMEWISYLGFITSCSR